MLFNSIEFFFFLPIVFCLYWFVFKKTIKLQNFLILFSSYIFYGWWDWRFLSLIFLSTLVDYVSGIKIYTCDNKVSKKRYLLISIFFNLGLLGFFKYYNFFIDSWVFAMQSIGYNYQSLWTLHIILPVGISFYTFQTMSYSLDIYYNRLKPTNDFVSFASFVAFFPQLVAGPIERASNLLPQLLNKRIFKYEQGVQGLRLILWGMFKKVVIADTLAVYVDIIFENYGSYNGGILLLGLIYFSFQIYCDFSGYSDIAIGTAKLFGIELMSNFKFPYFSRNIAEFWKRWHISLSSWFRDYVYIPLGGSRKGRYTSIKNVFIIFIVSGFWHGANWTFIAWGFVHGIFYIPFFIYGKTKKISNIVAEDTFFPSIKEAFQMILTFFSVMVAWTFFRSESIYEALKYLEILFFEFSVPDQFLRGIIFVAILIVIDWTIRYDERNPLSYKKRINFLFYKSSNLFRYIVYYILFLSILMRFNSYKEFIYFQF